LIVIVSFFKIKDNELKSELITLVQLLKNPAKEAVGKSINITLCCKEFLAGERLDPKPIWGDFHENQKKHCSFSNCKCTKPLEKKEILIFFLDRHSYF